MLYGEKNKEKLRSMAFGYGNKEDGSIIPKYSMNEESIDPDAAKVVDMGLAEQLSVRELEGAVNRIEAALPVVK